MCNRYNPARAVEIEYWRDLFGIDERPQGHIGDPLFPSLPRDIGPGARQGSCRLSHAAIC
jgi:hypothetical protein